MILVAAFVLIFGVDTSKVLLFVSSIILPSVFMFGNAAKVLFESLIFLFVTHPFDVGDRISVDGQPMIVEVIFATYFGSRIHRFCQFYSSFIC